MTRAEFQMLLATWCQDTTLDNLDLRQLKADVEFLEANLFGDYHPTSQGNHLAFGDRLARWIGNCADDADRRNLFLMFKHLLYISRDNFDTAYRTAFSKCIMSWLIECTGVNVFDINASAQLEECLSKLLFTRITDSFGLPEFIRVNGLHGRSDRYTWSEHLRGWSRNDFCLNRLDRGLPSEKKFLVLFEDFVGSGSQMETAVNFAVSLANEIPDLKILLCPLFICPGGSARAKALSAANPCLSYLPVLDFNEKFFLKPNPINGEYPDFQNFRELVTRLHPMVTNGLQDYGPFGYMDSGAFIVKHDNTPDNTLPVIHRQKEGSWEPVFFRASREQI